MLQAWARNVQAGKLSKGDRLGPADHANIDYLPFRRNFYIEVPELARMTDEQVAARRKDLDGLKVTAAICCMAACRVCIICLAGQAVWGPQVA